MRIVFAGTPEVAVPSLQALIDSRHEVLAVLTRPDARSGRGRRTAASPVKEVASSHGIEVLEPAGLREPGPAQRLAELAPDCCPVVAYGNLVPADLLGVPVHGWVNLHFSLLPAWRGAAPVQRAIIAGDEVTGATTFLLEAGMDTGPVLGTLTEAVRPNDTAGTLLARLASAGSQLLLATLDGLDDGTVHTVPQPAEGISMAPKLSVQDARVDWSAPALAVDRLIRGCTPAPGAWTTWRGDRIKLGPVEQGAPRQPLAQGEVLQDGPLVLVGTGSHPVALGEVQPAGKRPMPAADWARGVRPGQGERFGTVGRLGTAVPA